MIGALGMGLDERPRVGKLVTSLETSAGAVLGGVGLAMESGR